MDRARQEPSAQAFRSLLAFPTTAKAHFHSLIEGAYDQQISSTNAKDNPMELQQFCH